MFVSRRVYQSTNLPVYQSTHHAPSSPFPKFTKFQLAVHAAALAPLAVLVVAALTGGLSVNPIQDATFRTGKTALVLLVASLACTPANTVFGFRPAIKVRRALGLYAFLYAAIHFAIFIGLDYGFDLRLVALELAEKRYILVGAAALLILLAAGRHLDQGLAAPAGQDVEEAAPLGLPGRRAGDHPLHLGAEVGYS